jgi:hypothetical protein
LAPSRGTIHFGIEWPSRPVCILPIKTLLGKVPISGPRSSGENKRGYFSWLKELTDEERGRLNFFGTDFRRKRIILNRFWTFHRENYVVSDFKVVGRGGGSLKMSRKDSSWPRKSVSSKKFKVFWIRLSHRE